MAEFLFRGGKSPLTALTPEQNLAPGRAGTFGGNSGNILFYSAVHRVLSVPGTDLVPDGYRFERTESTDHTVAAINERFERYIIPLADAFRPSFEPYLGRLTRFIERLTIPVTVIGVGAAFRKGRTVESLSEPHRAMIVRFLRAVTDRSALLGVRGDNTAAMLRTLGFGPNHVDVIGCPSLFRDGPLPPLTKKRDRLTEDAKIDVHFTPHVPGVTTFVQTATEAFPNSRVIAQRGDRLALLLWGENPAKILRPAQPIHNQHPLYLQDRIRFFVDATPWIDYLRGFDFAIGTRIHGTIAAVNAGIPALLLTHDSRTAELAQYHGIPHIPFASLGGQFDLRQLYAEADFHQFGPRQQPTFDHYLQFLAANELDHVFLPGKENPAYDETLQSLPLPGPIHSLLAPGPIGREQIASRIAWLRQGATADSLRRVYAYTDPLDDADGAQVPPALAAALSGDPQAQELLALLKKLLIWRRRLRTVKNRATAMATATISAVKERINVRF